MLGSRTRQDLFIYADPPYVGTGGGYIESFNDKRLEDLVQRLIEVGCNFAISEFDSEHVLQIAENYNLNVIHILQRQSIKSVRNEILVTNYDRINTLF
jgi:site-specific DNA-adenine methylase